MAGHRFPSCSRSRYAPATRLALACALALAGAFAAEDPSDPWIDRIEPLGGQLATAVEVTLVGSNLERPCDAGIRFPSSGVAGDRHPPAKAPSQAGSSSVRTHR